MLSISKTFRKHRRLGTVLLSLLAVAAVILVLELTGATHFFHKPVATSSNIEASHPTETAAPNSEKQVSTSGGSTSPSTSSSTPDKATTAPTTPSGAGPAAPTGSFVSNHSPNLDGDPAPTREQSVCITTPGATCMIEFTSNGVVKKLDAQTADSNGAVYWTWDIYQAGFVPGNWDINVTASLNGKTATAKDSQQLVVQP